MKQGRIVRGIAGFYDVDVADSGVYACKARGIFRREGKKPLVGDQVEIEILSEAEKEGSLCRILPRRNALIRPEVANIHQAALVFALKEPAPNLQLLDKFLLSVLSKGIETLLCFHKADQATERMKQELEEIYRGSGLPLFFTSVQTGEGIEAFREALVGKVTVLAGPSGVGKSSLTNALQSQVVMGTGGISKKLGRGRHTTRHAQLISVGRDSYLVDTPGFSSFYSTELPVEKVKGQFPEFSPYEGKCRFQGCLHLSEPGCEVKKAVEMRELHPLRYESYQKLCREIKEQEKRRY